MVQNKENSNSISSNIYIEVKNDIYKLLFIPETLDIILYLYKLHKEDNHKGISSFRKYLIKINIYLEGYTFLKEYVVKNCTTCTGKKISRLKRELSKQIITYYPKQRYIMDLSELPIELKKRFKVFIFFI